MILVHRNKGKAVKNTSNAGCSRDSSTQVGRMKVNVEPVTRRKAQKNTGSTTAQSGTKSNGGFRRPSESGSKKGRTSKNEWKWQRGIVTHPLSESQRNRACSA